MDTAVYKRDFIRLWRKIKDKPRYWLVFIIWFGLFSFFPVTNLTTPKTTFFVDSASNNAESFDFDFDIAPALSQIENTFPSEIKAEALIVKERNSGQVLFSKNEHEKRSFASLTKMLSALVIVENCDLSREAMITNVQSIGSIMGLQDGERVTYKDLLYGMLVASGNDAAEFLARDCFGSEEHLVKKMNEKIDFLGLTNSHFEDVTGLSDDNHFSSAFDLSVIAEIVLRNSILGEMVDTQSISLVSIDQNRWYNLTNSNDLLAEYPQVYGVKTGYTEKAGECLVFAVNHNGHDYMVSLLGSSDRFEDGRKIIEWIETNY